MYMYIYICVFLHTYNHMISYEVISLAMAHANLLY